MRPRPAIRLIAPCLAGLLAACNPTGPAGTPSASPSQAAAAPTAMPTSTGAAASATPAASATAAVPTTKPSAAATLAPTPPPAQAQAGQEQAQAATGALADERRLAWYDLLADEQAPAAARRLLQADDADAKAAEVAVKLDTKGRTAARDRRAALRTKAAARLAALGEQRAAIAAALAKAASRTRAAGGTTRIADLELAGPGGTWSVRLVRAVDAEGDLVFNMVRARAKTGGVTIERARTLRADGGATITFAREVQATGGTALKSVWIRSETPDGALSGSGSIALASAGGATKSLLVTLKGTHDAPSMALKDAAAQLEAEVTLPIDGAPTAALVRLDAARQRVALDVKAD